MVVAMPMARVLAIVQAQNGFAVWVGRLTTTMVVTAVS
jgi:hypothetical protein